MSIQALAWAFDVQELKPTDKLVLLSLANHASKKEAVCFPSKKLIMEETGLSESGVRNAIKSLIVRGLVISKPQFRKDGSRTVNEYTLAVTGPPPPARSTPPIEEPSYNLPSSTEEGRGAPEDTLLDDNLSTEEALEKACFEQGRAVLGPKTGGVVTNLRRAINDDMMVLELLRKAVKKGEPIEWIQACIRNNGPPVEPNWDAIRAEAETG